MFQISGDLHIFTAEDRPDFRDARYFFGEADASCALDATGHYRFHDGTHVFLRHRPLILIIAGIRSEEHTSELQSLMRISYAVFCLKKKNNLNYHNSQVITNQHK